MYMRYRLDKYGNYEFKDTDGNEETTSSNHQSSNNNPSSTSNQYGAGTETYLPNQDNSYGLSTLNINSPQLDAKASVRQVLGPAPSKPAGQYYPSNPYSLGATLIMSAFGWSANGEYPGSSGTYNSGLSSREPIYRSHSEPAYQTRHERPTLDIFFGDKLGQEIRYIALLDSQSTYDWISDRIPLKLQLPTSEPSIHSSTGAEGNVVRSIGRVNLRWRKAPNGSRIYEDDFDIFQDPNIDVIFGWSTCIKYDLLNDNSSKLIPLISYNAETEDERRQGKIEDTKQRNGQRDSEARKQRSETRKPDQRLDKGPDRGKSKS